MKSSDQYDDEEADETMQWLKIANVTMVAMVAMNSDE